MVRGLKANCHPDKRESVNLCAPPTDSIFQSEALTSEMPRVGGLFDF